MGAPYNDFKGYVRGGGRLVQLISRDLVRLEGACIRVAREGKKRLVRWDNQSDSLHVYSFEMEEWVAIVEMGDLVDGENENFVQILKSFPQILNNIRLLQIEHDFQPNGVEGLEYFKKTMIENGFKMTDKFLKGKKYYGTSMPGLRWEDGLRSDPVFVSVWTR